MAGIGCSGLTRNTVVSLNRIFGRSFSWYSDDVFGNTVITK